jgi:hypothetical protein
VSRSKWEKLSLRERIAARIYVSLIHVSTEPITFFIDAWEHADAVARKKCLALSDSIQKEMEAPR